MSRTLFAYIFKDLFRIFMMASGAMAGIMSFGGLLRPLTREGLDAGQVARMLTYFGPAMTTYSFPVAAPFATAVVYGRLSADNELTACKAGGVSLLSLTVSGPALVLGLLVAIASLLFLCFIVPASTLKVEKVIYSNLAQLVESRIERTHEIRFQQATIFAQEAHVVPPGPRTPAGMQQVELIGPTIVSLERPDKSDRSYRVPKEFYTASRAYVYISPQSDGEEVGVTIRLLGGFKFPRHFEGATEMGVAETLYGPTSMPSPIKEDVKFMDVLRLKEIYEDVSRSRRVSNIVSDFVRTGQKLSSLTEIANLLNGPGHQAVFDFENGDRYTLGLENGTPASVWNNEIVAPPTFKGDSATAPASAKPAPAGELGDIGAVAATSPATVPAAKPVSRPILFRQKRAGEGTLEVRAAALALRARPLADAGLVDINVELKDCLQTSEGSTEPVVRESFPQHFMVPMSEATKSVAGHDLAFYEEPQNAYLGNQPELRREKTVLLNAIVAESNGRASFAISCLILVMVGAALGMMFRSGNFLTAFAVSFVPALLSITLIIAGQRTATNLPWKFDGTNNPLQLGLILIWAGNAVNLALAVGLLWRLGRR